MIVLIIIFVIYLVGAILSLILFRKTGFGVGENYEREDYKYYAYCWFIAIPAFIVWFCMEKVDKIMDKRDEKNHEIS